MTEFLYLGGKRDESEETDEEEWNAAEKDSEKFEVEFGVDVAWPKEGASLTS